MRSEATGRAIQYFGGRRYEFALSWGAISTLATEFGDEWPRRIAEAIEGEDLPLVASAAQALTTETLYLAGDQVGASTMTSLGLAEIIQWCIGAGIGDEPEPEDAEAGEDARKPFRDQIDSAFRAWCVLGLDPEAFWRTTPRVSSIVMSARSEAQIIEQRDRVLNTYRGAIWASFTPAERLPRADTLLDPYDQALDKARSGGRERVREMTSQDEMFDHLRGVWGATPADDGEGMDE